MKKDKVEKPEEKKKGKETFTRINDNTVLGYKDIKKKPEQTNLFGEKDQLYNTIQEEISIVVDMIKGCQDAIDKKEEQISTLQKRKNNLERAAKTAAKLRDEELSKKKEEKLKR